MKKLLGMLGGMLLLSCGAGQAAIVGPGGSAQGITYEFTIVGGALNSTSATFNIHITGINAVTDLEGGRSGINDFAFSTPGLPAIASGSSAFGTFTDGGLNSTGCNGSGGFFCFNGALPPNAPALPANSTIDIQFAINLTTGNFLAWTPSFKIDWVGSLNNYDLVSQDLVGSLTPTPFNNPIPLPGAVWMLFGGLAWIIGLCSVGGRRRPQLHELKPA